MMEYMENKKEVDAMVLQFKRSQRSNMLKFCSIMVLVFISVFGILALTSYIPKSVYDHFGVKYESTKAASVGNVNNPISQFEKKAEAAYKRIIRTARAKAKNVGRQGADLIGLGSQGTGK